MIQTLLIIKGERERRMENMKIVESFEKRLGEYRTKKKPRTLDISI